MKLSRIISMVAIIGAIAGFTACDKVETVDMNRTVVITTIHPPGITYHLDLGVNQVQTIANWDTTGDLQVSVEVQSGNTIRYRMSTSAMASQLKITVDGIQKMAVDISGIDNNTAVGFLLID